MQEDSFVVGGRDTPSPTSTKSSQHTRNTGSFTTANEYQHSQSLSLVEEHGMYKSAPGSPTPTKSAVANHRYESASTPTKTQGNRPSDYKEISTDLDERAGHFDPDLLREKQKTPSLDSTINRREPITEIPEIKTFKDTTLQAVDQDYRQYRSITLSSAIHKDLAPSSPPLPPQESSTLSPSMEIPAPELESANEIFGLTGKHYEHYYVCHNGLIPGKNVLGIPAKYAKFAIEGRAVEIRGVPAIVETTLMRPLFAKFSNNTLLHDICTYKSLLRS